MIVVAMVLVALLVLWRRKRRATLAGLNAVKPQFMVEPPLRRLGSRRTERL